MTQQLQPPTPPQTAARAPIRLGAQVLTCLVLCLVAAPIIYFVLALIAAAVSWLLFRMTASSASSARTVQSYARLDLSGMNPLWIAIAAAVGEEMLFRAALQPLLGVWIVSLLFLLTHVPVYRFRQLDGAALVQALSVFGGSVVLGFVFQYVGLIAAMLVHAWIDIVGLLIVRASSRSLAQ
jgi:membrane protease YdiL (CAAX protease family)